MSDQDKDEINHHLNQLPYDLQHYQTHFTNNNQYADFQQILIEKDSPIKIGHGAKDIQPIQIVEASPKYSP